MQRAETLTIEQIERFLAASEGVRLRALDREEIYSWVEGTLRAQQYEKQTKAVRGLLPRYLVKMTGLSYAQIDRLVRRFREHGQVKESGYRRHRFSQRYTRADIELLATVDEAHETLSGPATGSARPARLLACGHGASRRPGRSQRGVPHQCC